MHLEHSPEFLARSTLASLAVNAGTGPFVVVYAALRLIDVGEFRRLAQETYDDPRGWLPQQYVPDEVAALTARTGGGTRVSRSATTTPRQVLEAARRLAATGTQAGTDLDDAIRILRAVWPEE